MRYTGQQFDGMNSFDNSQIPSFDKISSHSSNSNSQASPKEEYKEGMLQPKSTKGSKTRKITSSSSGSKKSRNSNTSQTGS